MIVNRTKLLVGDDALDRLYYELVNFTCTRPLVISDSVSDIRLIKKYVTKVLSHTDADASYLFTDAVSDVIEYASLIYDSVKKNKCNSIIIAGSSLLTDAAKLAKAMLSQEVCSIDELDKTIRGDLPYPLIIISTGSGAINAAFDIAYYVDRRNSAAKSYREAALSPDIIIIDRRLSYAIDVCDIIVTHAYALAKSVILLLNDIDVMAEPYIVTTLKLIAKSIKPKIDVWNKIANENAYCISQAATALGFAKPTDYEYENVIAALSYEYGIDYAVLYVIFAREYINRFSSDKRADKLFFIAGIVDNSQDALSFAIENIGSCIDIMKKRGVDVYRAAEKIETVKAMDIAIQCGAGLKVSNALASTLRGVANRNGNYIQPHLRK